MTKNSSLSKGDTGLLVVDVQEKLFGHIERANDVLSAMLQTIKGFQILRLPIVVTEQYPQGLGHTVPAMKTFLGEGQRYLTKTTFSCMGDDEIRRYILSQPVQQWVIVGIEAHVCVLQTAKGLLSAGKDPVVLNDAISSRSLYDFSTAIAELRDLGIRVSSAETVLFELVRDSKAQEFKAISQLIKEGTPGCCCMNNNCGM